MIGRKVIKIFVFRGKKKKQAIGEPLSTPTTAEVEKRLTSNAVRAAPDEAGVGGRVV